MFEEIHKLPTVEHKSDQGTAKLQAVSSKQRWLLACSDTKRPRATAQSVHSVPLQNPGEMCVAPGPPLRSSINTQRVTRDFIKEDSPCARRTAKPLDMRAKR